MMIKQLDAVALSAITGGDLTTPIYGVGYKFPNFKYPKPIPKPTPVKPPTELM